MIENFLQEQFNVRAEAPAIWELSARRLKQSGDLLFNAYEIDLQKWQTMYLHLNLIISK